MISDRNAGSRGGIAGTPSHASTVTHTNRGAASFVIVAERSLVVPGGVGPWRCGVRRPSTAIGQPTALLRRGADSRPLPISYVPTSPTTGTLSNTLCSVAGGDGMIPRVERRAPQEYLSGEGGNENTDEIPFP